MPDTSAQDLPEIRIEPTTLIFENATPPDDPASQVQGSGNTHPGKLQNLLTYVGPPETVNLPPHVASARPVIINQRALQAPAFYIELAGEIFTAVQTGFETEKGQVIWVGHIENQPLETVIVTARGNSFAALIQQNGRTFELDTGPRRQSRLLYLDLTQMPLDDPYILPDGSSKAGTPTKKVGKVGTPTKKVGTPTKKIGTPTNKQVGTPTNIDSPADGNIIQDLLGVYTQSACDASGSCDQVVSNIVTAVAAMNTAYEASGINITMNLVGTHFTNYAGGDFYAALDDITGTSDGQMDEVHAVRDQLGADIVALVFGGDGEYCGLGWLNSSQSNAFSVTASGCVVGNRSFAHEIGHNQGAHHDRVSAEAGDSTNYNYGFRRCSDGTAEDLGPPYFRTIMAYYCDSAFRQGIYSNPDINYQGVPQGVDPSVEPTGGAHNARRLNERAATVAAFRESASRQEFVIYNDGDGELSVTDIQLEAAAAWISWTPTTPFTVPAGGSQTVYVEIDYSNAPDGVSNNRLLVYSNDADESPYPNAVLLSVDNSGVACVDDGFEPLGLDGTDDLCFGSNMGSLPATQTHKHCDVDWVTFEAEAGVDYVIETSNLVGGSDTTLSLHFDCGEQIAFNDDGSSELYASRIQFTAQNSGWYDIQVRQFFDAYEDGEGYDITVSPLVVCNTVTLDFTGSGAAPSVTPTSSAGCADGSFAPGEQLSLTANPAVGWTVGSWSGTDNDASKALNNTWTMGDATHAVTVNYVEGEPMPEISISPTSLDFIELPADLVEANVGVTNVQGAVADLLSDMEPNGRVRIIVGLDVNTRPEGGLNALQKANQRSRIRRAQDDFLNRLGLAHGQARKFKTIPHVSLSVTARQLSRVARMPGVVNVQEDVLSRPTLASSNPVIGSPAAWAEGYDGTGFAVAVLDTGVDKTHPFLSTDGNKVVSEACYSSNYVPDSATSVCPGGVETSTAVDSGVPCDMAQDTGCAHGTHVAGIVAGNDGEGPDYGVARGADIIAIQVFSMFSSGSICSGAPPCVLTYGSDQISGLERVLELSETMDIAAANMSLGGGAYSNQASCDADNAAEKAIIDNLRSAGIATVIASGNEFYTDAMGGPACISSAVSVGSTTDADDISSFSNVADFLDLLAPGSSINSAVPGGGTESWNGTSMATPHVAGAWAVLKQKSPDASVDDLLTVLRDTGTSIDDQRSGGSVTDMRRINLDGALASLESASSKKFMIANLGGADLEITSLALETPMPWITWSIEAPFTITPGADQTITVEIDFATAPAGISSNRLLVYSNDEINSPYPAAVIINIDRSSGALIFSNSFEQ